MKRFAYGMLFCAMFLFLASAAYGASACPESPAPNEVLLFTEENFQGECTSYAGFNRDISDHESPVASIKLGSGIRLEICVLRRMRGRCSWVYDAETPVFDKVEKQRNWRSLAIRKNPVAVVETSKPCLGGVPSPGVEAAAEQVAIFTEVNFGGKCDAIEYKGRDQQPYPYSLEWSYPTRDKFFSGVGLRNGTFNSIKIGSGLVVTMCTGKNLQGNCKEFTQSVADLTEYGIVYDSINSFKIFTLNPKNYANAALPNDNEVTVCQQRTFGGGCRKLTVGNHDFNGLTYLFIQVGKNVKAQTYSDRSFFGPFEVYPGGSKQATTGGRHVDSGHEFNR